MKDLFLEADRVKLAAWANGHSVIWDGKKGGKQKGYCTKCSCEVVISEYADTVSEILTTKCPNDKPWKNTYKPEKQTRKKTESEDLLAELEEDGLI